MNSTTQPPNKSPQSHEQGFRQSTHNQQALQTLKAQLDTFTQRTDQRMSRVEGMVSKTLGLISMQHEALTLSNQLLPQLFNTNRSLTSPPPAFMMQTQAPSSFEVATFEPNQASSSSSNGTNLRLELVDVQSRWFTKRPFPDFEIRVVDAVTGGLFTKTTDWNVSLRLVSGHGLYVDNFLANPASLVFPVKDGKANVSGLKFLAVSSRNGGHFRFEVSARLPESTKKEVTLPAMRSTEVNILSERLKNESKARSILDLRADDPLVRVPGIGKRYAQKLAEQGLATIRDLAKIDNSPQSRKTRLALLNSVRKDRGALTEAKLAEMLRQAKAVVKRETSESPTTSAVFPSLAMPQVNAPPALRTNPNSLAHNPANNMDFSAAPTKEQLKAKEQQIMMGDMFPSFNKTKLIDEQADKLLTETTVDSEVDAMLNFQDFDNFTYE